MPFDLDYVPSSSLNNARLEEDATRRSNTEFINSEGVKDSRALSDYAIPTIDGINSSILKPAVESRFEIKIGLIQLIQKSVKLGGLPNEDPYERIADFLEICDTFKYEGVSDDRIKLRLFSFSLKDKAKV